MTANNTIKTDIVIKSIQSLSMLNFVLLAYGSVAERSHALVMYIIVSLYYMSCTNNLYRYFLTDEHSHEQRQSINSAVMTKVAD